MDERVRELEQAIKDANKWLIAGEGVNLLYYYRYAYPTQLLSPFIRSKEVIEEILGESA